MSNGNGAVAVRWEVPSHLSWEDFCSRMRDVGRFHRQFPFYVGDLLRIGEDLFHEKASQMINEVGLAPETLANYKSVAGRIPFEERCPQVPFTVYQDIAALPRPERDRIVAGYLGGNLNRADIRALKSQPNGNGASNGSDGSERLPSAKEMALERFGLAMVVCAKLMKYGDEENLKEALDDLTAKAVVLRGML